MRKAEEKPSGRPPRLASRYFSLLWKRSFSEADEMLRHVKENAKTDWERGYSNAMEGLMTAFRSEEDRLLYLNKIKGDPSALRKARARFLRMRKEPKFLTTPFDEGYIKCWLDLLKSLEALSKEGTRGR